MSECLETIPSILIIDDEDLPINIKPSLVLELHSALINVENHLVTYAEYIEPSKKEKVQKILNVSTQLASDLNELIEASIEVLDQIFYITTESLQLERKYYIVTKPQTEEANERKKVKFIEEGALSENTGSESPVIDSKIDEKTIDRPVIEEAKAQQKIIESEKYEPDLFETEKEVLDAATKTDTCQQYAQLDGKTLNIRIRTLIIDVL